MTVVHAEEFVQVNKNVRMFVFIVLHINALSGLPCFLTCSIMSSNVCKACREAKFKLHSLRLIKLQSIKNRWM